MWAEYDEIRINLSRNTFTDVNLCSRMAALNACLNAMTASNLQIEKIAVFEDLPHALLQISQDKPKTPTPKDLYG